MLDEATGELVERAGARLYVSLLPYPKRFWVPRVAPRLTAETNLSGASLVGLQGRGFCLLRNGILPLEETTGRAGAGTVFH
jgi:hypothetical protein